MTVLQGQNLAVTVLHVPTDCLTLDRCGARCCGRRWRRSTCGQNLAMTVLHGKNMAMTVLQTVMTNLRSAGVGQGAVGGVGGEARVARIWP